MLHAFMLKNQELLEGSTLEGPLLRPIEKHLKALRIKRGEDILLLDGSGRITKARCTQHSPYCFSVLHTGVKDITLPRISLILSPPKTTALYEAIAQSTEMGVHSFQYWYSDNCTQKPSDFEKIYSRSLRVIEASCEQCAQPYLPSVAPRPLKNINELIGYDCLIVGDESLSSTQTRGFDKPTVVRTDMKIALFVGPEGGWSPAERQKFDEVSATKLSLGPLILRVPTACVSALSYIFTVAKN